MIFPFHYYYQKYSGGSSLLLPKVGPFASLSATKVSSLSNVTLGGSITSTRLSPQKANLLQCSQTDTQPNDVTSWAIFLWCNTISVPGFPSFNVRGQDGQPGQDDQYGGPPFIGGAAGFGGGGGGGGSSNTSSPFLALPGGNGNGITNGTAGQDDGTGNAGQGGIGSEGTYAAGFSYGLGGGGGLATNDSGSPGSGQNGSGGGGAGQGVGTDALAGGGGGGGGGLFCAVANEWIGTSGTVAVGGGSGGNGTNNLGGSAGNGGEGVCWLAFKKYDGSFTLNGLGTVTLYEIKKDLTLVQHVTLTDTWNNL